MVLYTLIVGLAMFISSWQWIAFKMECSLVI